jgi:hypothetical protein
MSFASHPIICISSTFYLTTFLLNLFVPIQQLFDSPSLRHEHQKLSRHSQDLMQIERKYAGSILSVPRRKPTFAERLVCFECSMQVCVLAFGTSSLVSRDAVLLLLLH